MNVRSAHFRARVQNLMSTSQSEAWDEEDVTVNDEPLDLAPSPSLSAVERSASTAALGILLVGHGKRRPQGRTQFEGLVQAFAARFPDWRVRSGYVELAEPSLEDALAEQASNASRVVLVPVFLLLAGHVKNDLPLALEKARKLFPATTFALAPPIGVDLRMCELAYTRMEVGISATDLPRTMCLLVGRGSSDPDANGDFHKIARLVAEGRGLERVEPCFLGITDPDVPTGLDLLARLRPKRIVVAPYVLFPGRLLERLDGMVEEFRRSHPWIRIEVTGPLGADPVVLDLLAERAMGALDGNTALPCDTCQYREALPDRAREVGGLRALLWSMRHTFTHSQAMPAEHAHAAVEKHVFVCANADCAARGSLPLLSKLRQEVKQAGLGRKVRVTKSSCMGRCGEGPSVAVYPDGIWYREVQAADAAELVREHFKGDRLVARLVDNILQ